MQKLSLFLLAFVLLLGVNSASAFDIKLDIGTALPGHSEGDADDFTDVFEQFSFKAETTTTQFGTLPSGPVVGDVFSDFGDLYMTDYVAATNIDDEGLGSVHEFTMTWGTGSLSTLDGVITSSTLTSNGKLVQTFDYTGGQFEMYVDDSMDRNFGSSVGAGDNSGFTNGQKVATLSLMSGSGTNTFASPGGVFESGSSNFNLKFDSVLDNFWYDEFGVDLNEKLVSFEWFIALADQNTDDVVTNFTGIDNGGNGQDELFQILSNHDGSIDPAAIPEPTTMLLFGTGLLGLAAFGRKKFMKN